MIFFNKKINTVQLQTPSSPQTKVFPSKRLTDQRDPAPYVPGHSTDIRKTWAAAQLTEKKHEH